MADKEEDMKSMIERLENYLDKKGLELNVSKTKVRDLEKEGEGWRKESGDGKERN